MNTIMMMMIIIIMMRMMILLSSSNAMRLPVHPSRPPPQQQRLYPPTSIRSYFRRLQQQQQQNYDSIIYNTKSILHSSISDSSNHKIDDNRSAVQQRRNDARQLIDTVLLPTSEKGYRMNLNANDNNNNQHDDDDSSTYGEFSLSSLDILLDRIFMEPQFSITNNNNNDSNMEVTSDFSLASGQQALHQQQFEQQRPSLTIIDIGSGCGRLILYMAMTLQQQQQQQQQEKDNIEASNPTIGHKHNHQYTLIGIEQSQALYSESIRATERLLQTDRDHTTSRTTDSDRPKQQQPYQPNCYVTNTSTSTTIQLFCGSVQDDDCRDIIHSINTDILICYSTAFTSGNFLPSISAVLLSEEWNTVLTPPPIPVTTARSSSTKRSKPLYCITIDKALDPQRGWIIIDRINVPNPELGCDSMAFIQRYDR